MSLKRTFSVLIPTYNRLDKLKTVLQELYLQPDILLGEVIVGVDGSTDGTVNWLEQKATVLYPNLRFFRIENSGRSVIRNQLLERAQGEVILFIQDDIVVSKHWLSTHLSAHGEQSLAVVGYVTWYPKQEITSYMRWLENGGHMLSFAGLKNEQTLRYWRFYMGNISLSADLAKNICFDESLKTYGWEDIIYGYHWEEQGGSIIYAQDALAWHWDTYTLESFDRYMQQLASSALVVHEKYPEAYVIPRVWKQVVLVILILWAYPFKSFFPQTWQWYLQMKTVFLTNLYFPEAQVTKQDKN